MKPSFEIVLKAKDPANPITRLTAVVVGMPRNDAILFVEGLYGEQYEVYYVINGAAPRNMRDE